MLNSAFARDVSACRSWNAWERSLLLRNHFRPSSKWDNPIKAFKKVSCMTKQREERLQWISEQEFDSIDVATPELRLLMNSENWSIKPDDLFDSQTAGEILNHPLLARLRHLPHTP